MICRFLLALLLIVSSAWGQMPHTAMSMVSPTTRTFTDAQIAFGYSGWWDTTFNAARRYWQAGSPGGSQSWWNGYIRGTSATMVVTAGASTPLHVVVDGGADTNPPISGGVITLFSGLADIPHLVQIRLDLGYGSHNTYTPLSGTVFSVTGTFPSVNNNPDFGPTYIVEDTAFPGQASIYKGISALSYSTILTTAGTAGIRFPGVTPSLWTESGAILFNARATGVYLMTGGCDFWYSIDGGTITQTVIAGCTTSTSLATWRKVLSGLDDTATHTYMIMPSLRTGDSPLTVPPSAIRLAPGSATFQSMTARKRVTQFGDSITQGMSDASAPTGSVDTYRIANTLGLMPQISGYGGKNVAGLLAALTTGSPPYLVLYV